KLAQRASANVANFQAAASVPPCSRPVAPPVAPFFIFRDPREFSLSNTTDSPPVSAQTDLPSLAGRAYRCQCGCPVFFRNSTCLACGTPLGYDTVQARLLPLMRGQDPDTWVEWQAEGAAAPTASAAPATAYLRCTNLQTPA